MKKTLLSIFIAAAMAGCGGGGTSEPASTGTGTDIVPDDGAGPGAGNEPVYQARVWSTGFQISNPNREAQNPSVKVLEDGTVFASWIEAATEEHSSAVYASVLRADLPESERQRDALQISQLDDANETVVANTRWNFTGEVERFIPSPKLAASNDGVAHVAWLQNDGTTTSVYVSDYIPQGNAWSAAVSVESTNEACSEIKLLSLSNGDTVLLWKQTGDDSVSLKGILYSANTADWGTVFDVATSVKTEADVSLWEKDGIVSIAYLSSIDIENDRLTVAVLELTGPTVSYVVIDDTGLKASVVGTQLQSSDVVVWAEMDEFGYYSIAGAVNAGVQWEAVSQVEDRPYDVGHISVSAVGDDLHIVWRHKDQSSTAIFHDLNTVTYSSSGVSDIQTLFDSGAANPVLVNDGDGKLYAQWFTSHTKYSEYVPGDGWKSVSQPFCMAGNVISGSCFNSGTEHSLDVSSQYGVSAWLESVNGIRSVVVSLSE